MGHASSRATPSASSRATPSANGRDPQAVTRFVERFAAVLTEAGIPRMPSRVFAALLVTDSGSLTSAELSQQLQVSPAAVSGAVRYLSQFSLVSREREPGSRRDRYRVVSDSWFEASAQRDGILASWGAAALEGSEVLGYDTPAGQRFAESREYFEFVRKELSGVLARWHEYKGRSADSEASRTRAEAT